MLSGRQVSHYRILEKLGAGGMGEVYRAEDIRLKRVVAVKFLPPGLTRDPGARERFIQEARAASALDHPNICTIHEIDETAEGQLFLVMNCYQGQTLKDRIISSRQATPATPAGPGSPLEPPPGPIEGKTAPAAGEAGNDTVTVRLQPSRPLTIEETTSIASQIAEGLAAAHKQGIIHRDIKPANIFLTVEGRIKILDFGLAKLAGQPGPTRLGTTMGTVAYMSPEQALGEEVGQRTDIWSLGVVLYEMLTGQLPFKGNNDQAIIYAILNRDTGALDNVPEEFRLLLRRLLRRNPDQRPADCGEIITELHHLAVTPATTSGKPKPFWRSKLAWLALAVSLPLVAALLLFFWKPAPPAKQETGQAKPSLAIVYFENLSGDKKLDKWRNALAELLITDLAQSKLIDVRSGDQVFSVLRQLELLEVEKYSRENLREICLQCGTGYVLKGSYLTAGSRFLINVTLQEAGSGNIVSSLRLECRDEEELFLKLDEISDRIKLGFNLPARQLAADRGRELAAITTRSPLAFTYYTEGRTQFNLGNNQQSIELMKKAVAIDPGFASAYRIMARANGSLGYLAEYENCWEKAMANASRVSDRERLLITGDFFAEKENTYPRAISAYERLLQDYPEESLALFGLGHIHLANEEWAKAARYYGHPSLQRNPESRLWSYIKLLDVYRASCQYEKVGTTLVEARRQFPGNKRILWFVVCDLLVQGKFPQALTVIKEKFASDPDSLNGRTFEVATLLCQGKLDEAAGLCREMTAASDAYEKSSGLGNHIYCQLLWGHHRQVRELSRQLVKINRRQGWDSDADQVERMVANWEVWQEKPGRVREVCRPLLVLAEQKDDRPTRRRLIYLAGLAFAGEGKMADARQSADTLQEMLQSCPNRNESRLLDHLRGWMAFQQGRHGEAAELYRAALAKASLDKIIWTSERPEGRFPVSLGEACLAAGQYAEARTALEIIVLSPAGRLNIYYPECLHLLARACEKLGDSDAARRYGHEFLALYHTCDPELQPRVEEVRQLLRRLPVAK